MADKKPSFRLYLVVFFIALLRLVCYGAMLPTASHNQVESCQLSTEVKADECLLGKCHHDSHISTQEYHKDIFYFSPYILPEYLERLIFFSCKIEKNILESLNNYYKTNILSPKYRGPPIA